AAAGRAGWSLPRKWANDVGASGVQHGDRHPLHLVVDEPAHVPPGPQGLEPAGRVAGADAELVVAGPRVPHGAEPPPRPPAARLRPELRLLPGVAAVSADLDPGDRPPP